MRYTHIYLSAIKRATMSLYGIFSYPYIVPRLKTIYKVSTRSIAFYSSSITILSFRDQQSWSKLRYEINGNHLQQRLLDATINIASPSSQMCVPGPSRSALVISIHNKAAKRCEIYHCILSRNNHSVFFLSCTLFHCLFHCGMREIGCCVKNV